MFQKKFVSKDCADYAQAQVFDKLRVGNDGVYFRDGLRIRFIPYEDMDRAFIRVHQANARMCCGTASFEYYRMVFVKDGDEYACEAITEKEKAMDDALACLVAKAPQVAIGKV